MQEIKVHSSHSTNCHYQRTWKPFAEVAGDCPTNSVAFYAQKIVSHLSPPSTQLTLSLCLQLYYDLENSRLLPLKLNLDPLSMNTVYAHRQSGCALSRSCTRVCVSFLKPGSPLQTLLCIYIQYMYIPSKLVTMKEFQFKSKCRFEGCLKSKSNTAL